MGDDLPVEGEEYLAAVKWHLEHPEGFTEPECPTCGAYVVNREKHEQWHHDWRSRISHIGDSARRYVSPPVYG